MKQLSANSLDELKHHLANFGDDYLFRGQVSHYADNSGLPILNSSFVRHGCVPPLMLKWIFYAQELLRRGGFDVERPDTNHITQGLLQHYGWRSFFVDLSSSQGVAAWFASHSFQSNTGFNFCENSFEEAVMLRVNRAHYVEAEGFGNIYVLRKSTLDDSGHKLVSLVDDLSTDETTRFAVQRAWLAGIFRGQRRLAPSAIVAQIIAPTRLLRAIASEVGFNETEDLFPPPKKDAILKNLLSLPLLKLSIGNPMFPTYMRSLEIPEYQDSFVKHLPTTTALAEAFWPSDVLTGLKDGLCIRVEEEVFYGAPSSIGVMPHLLPLLELSSFTHVETENLICLPFAQSGISYEKGLAIRKRDDGLFEIGGLSVDYISNRVSGAGVAKGYSYKIDANRLVRVPTKDDCPCGDPTRHFYHLRACAVLDDLLGSGKAQRDGNVLTVTY